MAASIFARKSDERGLPTPPMWWWYIWAATKESARGVSPLLAAAIDAGVITVVDDIPDAGEGWFRSTLMGGTYLKLG